ncbi:MAG TPA: cysteine hydrolase family protein [Candidatus Brocadiia bacterium]|nr:cysteine hydrolase [Candidatus Brocadiales bacterium]
MITHKINPKQTALLLISFQNDFFASNGVLRRVIEESSRVTNVLANTVDLVEHLLITPVLIISTPIIFTEDYSELIGKPIGILKTIKEARAFKRGTKGAEIVPELRRFGDRIIEVPGRRGFNAFSNTDLNVILQQRNITNVVLTGAVTSICVDPTGRYAFELGYKVTILSDCTAGRSNIEQEFYCKEIFPLYAEVMDHLKFLKCLGVKK